MIEVLPRDRSFAGKVLVAGFHGIGATGYYAIRYMTEYLKARRVAYVESDLTAPVSTARGGRVVTPIEIYEYGELAFLRVDVPVQRENELAFYRELAKWVVSSGFSEVALVGGLDSTLRNDESTYRVVFTSAFTPRGILRTSKVLEDELIIVGPVAVMLNYFEMAGFPAYAVLAYASVDRVDPRAAANAVGVLSEVYGLGVDVKPLLADAEVIEKSLKPEMKEVKPRSDSMYA